MAWVQCCGLQLHRVTKRGPRRVPVNDAAGEVRGLERWLEFVTQLVCHMDNTALSSKELTFWNVILLVQIVARLFSTIGPAATVTWTYARCAEDEFTTVQPDGGLLCSPCPSGGECRDDRLSTVPALLSLPVPLPLSVVCAANLYP